MRFRRFKLNRAGFSLTELLAAVLILAMVSTVVAGGIPVARDAYRKVTVSANAQVLLSTTISALRNQLGTATIEKVGTTDVGDAAVSGASVTFLSGLNGASSQIRLDGGVLTIQEFINYSGVEPRPLVPGTDGLYATYSSGADAITFNSGSGVLTIKGLTVKKSGETREYITPINLSIKVIGN